MNKIIVLILTLLLIACSADENTNTEHGNTRANPDAFIKAAHYFGDAWPITFWQEFELDKVADDLAQIKHDGFNTVILVVPWRGFETGFDQRQTTSNAKMYQRLEFVLDEINKKELDFMLRLGYPHNYAPSTDPDGIKLCTAMYTDSKQTKKWLHYLKNIRSVTQKFDHNLVGVFTSWEDFWCPHGKFPDYDEVSRKALANSMRYTKWLARFLKQDPAAFLTSLGPITLDTSTITIPRRDDFSYAYYLQFIDQQMNDLILTPMRQVFPQASMEVRTDKALVNMLSGPPQWAGHNLYLDDPNHRGTYWAAFWGAENKGEKLTAKQALSNFEYFLNYVTNSGKSINHIIEQFNFFDNTPQFPNNANIINDEINDFLISTVPLLKQYSTGYGIWVYRDYRDNVLYNASFEMGLAGWDIIGEASLTSVLQDNQLNMKPDSAISQYFEPRTRFIRLDSYKHLDLRFTASSEAKIDVYIYDTLIASLDVKEGENLFSLPIEPFLNHIGLTFKLVAKSDVTIDEINLSGFTQSLGLYDAFNQPGPHLDAIRKVNALLDEPILVQESPEIVE